MFLTKWFSSKSSNFDKWLNCIFDIISLVRLRESYKRFVKTWIRFMNPWICIVSCSRILTPKRFNPCLTKQILDLYRIVYHKSGLKKIRFKLWIMNPANFQRFVLISRIQWILTNLHDVLSTVAQILTNLDLQVQTLKICIADLICRPVFKRFVSWILYVRAKISNYLIWKDYKSCKLNHLLFWSPLGLNA